MVTRITTTLAALALLTLLCVAAPRPAVAVDDNSFNPLTGVNCNGDFCHVEATGFVQINNRPDDWVQYVRLVWVTSPEKGEGDDGYMLYLNGGYSYDIVSTPDSFYRYNSYSFYTKAIVIGPTGAYSRTILSSNPYTRSWGGS